MGGARDALSMMANLPLAPIAVLIRFGPAGSTFLDTIVVPALYFHFGGLRKAFPRAPSEGNNMAAATAHKI